MYMNDVSNATSKPSVNSDDMVYVKFSVPSAVIDESYLATLFRLRDTTSEMNGDIKNIIITLDYIDPRNFPDEAAKFGVKSTDNLGNAHIPSIIQLYASVRDMNMLISSLRGSSISGEGDIQMGLFLPHSESGDFTYDDEYLQLLFDGMRSNDDIVTLQFYNHTVVKRRDDVSDYIEKMASREDIIKIFEDFNFMVSKVSENTEEMPDPALLAQSPAEMMERMLGIQYLDGGLVAMPREGDAMIMLSTDHRGAELLSRAIMREIQKTG